MLPLAGLVATAVGVIIAVAFWSLRSGGSRDEEDYDEPGVAVRHEDAASQPVREQRNRQDQRERRERRDAVGRKPANGKPVGIPAGNGRLQPVAEQHTLTPPDGVRTERQGDDVAKSRPRFGLGDRVGWRRRTDVDAEMWPEETFGGVSDEQFWDDLASDKPLATTARTPQPEPSRGVPARPRPGDQRPGDQRPGDQRPAELRLGERRLPDRSVAQPGPNSGPQPAYPSGHSGPQPIQAFPASAVQSAQGTTQAFQITSPQPSEATGPLPARPGTQPQPARRHAAAPQPYQSTQPAPLPPLAPATGQRAPAPVQQHIRPTPGRGRHSSGEDPLTSSAYSLRSDTGVDGRSYQASRRARELTREQYEAAISQETQTFSMVDAEANTGGYPDSTRWAPSGNGGGNGYGGTGGYPYSYGQPGQATPVAPPTPPYGQSFGTRDGGAPDPRWGSGARDYGRPPAGGGRTEPGRAERPPAYPAGYPGPHEPRGTDRY